MKYFFRHFSEICRQLSEEVLGFFFKSDCLPQGYTEKFYTKKKKKFLMMQRIAKKQGYRRDCSAW